MTTRPVKNKGPSWTCNLPFLHSSRSAAFLEEMGLLASSLQLPRSSSRVVLLFFLTSAADQLIHLAEAQTPRLNPFALHDVLETAPQFFQCPLAKHPILCARALKRYRTHRRVLGELLNPSNVSLGGYGYFSRSFAVLAPVYP